MSIVNAHMILSLLKINNLLLLCWHHMQVTELGGWIFLKISELFTSTCIGLQHKVKIKVVDYTAATTIFHREDEPYFFRFFRPQRYLLRSQEILLEDTIASVSESVHQQNRPDLQQIKALWSLNAKYDVEMPTNSFLLQTPITSKQPAQSK